MLSNKSLGIAGVAMLGTVALLGTNAANAAINVSQGSGGVVYALETLDVRNIVVDDDGNHYYRLAGDADTLHIVSALGIPGTGKDRYSVTYDLSGMVIGGQTTAADDTDGDLIIVTTGDSQFGLEAAATMIGAGDEADVDVTIERVSRRW